MSSLPPSDAPSPEAEPGAELALASLVRVRGGPLLDALERHAPGSRAHAEGTATYAFAAAVELGFERGAAELVREAAKLHEIGTVYMPRETLAKAGRKLEPAEVELLESRFEAGERLARGAGVPEQACLWIRLSADRFDGAGSDEPSAAEIPIEARILRGACACDAALAAPDAVPGREERRREAIDELRGGAGTELDPRVVEALVTVLERSLAPG